MKILSLITIFLMCTHLFGTEVDFETQENEISIKAYVIDRETKQPVPYVEIGFLNLERGVISDKNGYFELKFRQSDLDRNDTLLFQSANYFPIKMNVDLVKEYFSKHPILLLTKEERNNSKLELASNIIETKPTEIDEPTRFWKINSITGQEIITSLAHLEMSSADSIMYYLKFENTDSLKLKLKFYDGLREKRFQRNNYKTIYHNVKASGWQIIPLDLLDINSYEDLLIGIQVVDSYEKDFQVNLGLSENYKAYQKVNSHAKLNELPFFGVNFKVLPLQENVLNERLKPDKNKEMISGIVLSNGKPLNKATVKINHSLNEIQTNSEGLFKIEAEVEDKLVFSHFSAQPKEVKIQDDGFLQVEMSRRYIDLDTVTITKKKQAEDSSFPVLDTPFGKVKKRTSGYANYTRTIDELNRAAITFSQLIQGKFPGLRVQRGVGGIDSFTLRGGISSVQEELSSGTAGQRRGALVVVDGVPDQLNGSLLDVNNIASVSVITGYGGTSRYGTLGRGGVILVTTKAGNFIDKRDNQSMKEMVFNKNLNHEKSTKVKLEDLQVFDFISSSGQKYTIDNYKEQLEDNKQSVPFYIESFKYFYKKGEKEVAKSILDSLENLLNNNVKGLKSLAFTYEEYGLFDGALQVHQKIGSLQPYSTQTYLDLAQNYTDLKQYTKASDLYLDLINNKIPGLILDESSIELAEIKLKHLLTKYKSKLDLDKIDDKYYTVAQTFDAFMVIDWNDVDSSFEIQYINSENKYFSSSHNVMSDFDRLNYENETGYHTEFFILKNISSSDNWKIALKGNEENSSANNPNYVRFTLYRNYGSTNESRSYKIVNLNKLEDQIIDIASFYGNEL
ncbi:TonB-dependent receptor plug domain-containing protein [Psychroflexus tropicus]|uniref:TonB-dependent receptor plug domain-containing protein n=1 Tax=Psychroflexus tropicus TaxID=197345 RepID=UPI00037EB8E0|nr:TonB-dependent receptor plug domain-containing protein [Psychroflexus tropicus]